MADSVATLRPNGTVEFQSGGGLSIVGSGTYEGALSDDSDASYVTATLNGYYIVEDFTTFSVPAGAVVKSLQPRVRYLRSASFDNVQMRLAQNGTSGLFKNQNSAPSGSGIANFSGTAVVVGWSGSSPWTQAEINAIQLLVQNLSGLWTAYEAYIDVIYNQLSVVSAVTVPIASREDVTISWTYTDPEADAQTNYQVKVFKASVVTGGGFDPNTSSADYDSGSVASAAVSVLADANLSDGRFYAYVRATDAGTGSWSAWAASSEFRIVDDPVMMI